ncbi:MAG: PspC protein [Ferruginibacter sp.]|jgi:phage shock protein PspC (stress-responsive transcriptional regulator)|uniref:PspC domain-containing protein n=1 Tax=Ferruginibacter sp. TaxID=1940288 RepID=UPI00265A23C2|nr:PspC domain-containing protein [Ferruginibacter sp.]MDB5276840.1 PspC protein [Ferruginibacter sp.]
MKQVININFHGQVVPIEVSAFDLLKQYTASLNTYFANEEGKEEIINDIESRIAELFQERLKKGVTCITDEDVNAIIKSMGRPEEFEGEDSTAYTQTSTASSSATGNQQSQQNTTSAGFKRLYRDETDKILGGVCAGLANYFGIDVVIVRIIFVVLAISFGFGLIPYIILWIAVPSTATKIIGGTRKRLFRDPDDKKIAGVCSGIGNYFGINPWIPRVLFLLPFLTFVFHWSHWGFMEFPNFLRLGFSPGALIIYIILWLVIPEATSTAEKLEMKGEKVDLNSIKNSVVEEMKGVQQRAERLGHEARAFAEEKGKTMGAEMGSAARRSGRSLGDIIVFIVKGFAYFIIGCFGFAFVVALFAFAVASIGVFPLKDFLLTDGLQNYLAWGTLIFFIAVPVIGIITWIIRRLAKMKSNRKVLRFTFISLYIIGWACFISLIASVGRDFKSMNNIIEQDVNLANPGIAKLEITNNSPLKKYYRNNWLKFEPFQNLDDDTVFVENVSIKIIKATNDSFRVTMIKMANGENRRSADTLARLIQFNVAQHDSLLLLDKGIPITKDDKFRNQRVIITVYVPVGKQIRIDRNVGWNNNIHFSGPWNDHYNDLDIDDEERGWQTDVNYVMRANGLYTLTGKPADEWKNGDRNKRDDNDDDREDNDTSKSTNNSGGTYRYNSAQKIDSLKTDLQKVQQQYKDSLLKEQNDIKKKQEENKKKLEKLNVTISDTEPAGDTLLQSYSPVASIGLI